MTDYVTQQLRTVLKTYQDSAPKSLQGPGLSLVHPHKKELESLERNDDSPNQTCLPPVLPQPILSAPDPGRGVLYETILEGKPIGCFLLGGEMRLCLPQILNNILTDFSLEQINRSFDDLMIFCSQCTPDQLQEFKVAKILPEDVKGSGLITRTNAERLCSALIHRSDHHRYRSIKGAISFRVYHRCFGKCEGICTPDLFTLKDPSFIECRECHGMFTPQKFVCHVHNSHENRTCHWGFDSGSWRAYIQVALDEVNREKYSKMLDDIREQEIQESLRIINQPREREMCHPKRKAIDENLVLKTETLDIPLKKPKLMTDAFIKEYQLQYMHNTMSQQQMSAFRPWIATQQLLQNKLPFNGNGILNGAVTSSPNGMLCLNNEPPVLQNPERVVRLSESERFERTYQPNVALAPRKSILCKEKEREREREKEREREHEREKERADKERSVIKCDVQIKQEKSTTPPQIPMCAPSMDYGRSVIKCDVQIKQERSTTPLHNEILNSPELRMPPSPKSPMPPTIKSNPIPFSTHKEIQSGSNEITSSTSPVPNNGNDGFLATPIINGLTSSKLLIKESLSSPPPPPRRTPVPLENIHHKPHQQVIIVKNGITNNVGLQLPNSGTAIFGNPEFELSTDTDDDSIEGCAIGEPDSSNLMAPWDQVVDVLKEVQPEGRNQILNLLKVLIQDNTYLKQMKMENARLLKQKDEQIAELMKRPKDNLQQTVNQLQQQLNRALIKNATSEANILQMQQQHQQQLEKMAAVVHSSTLSSPSPSTTTPTTINCNNNSQIIIEKVERRNSFAEKGDVIMKPLKKSIRRSPEDTVLIMQSPPPPPPPPPDFQNSTAPLPILVKREIIINDELLPSASLNKISSPSQVLVDIKVKDNTIKSANN